MPKKIEAGIVQKNAKGHNYKYTDLAKVNEYVASQGWRYYQYTETEKDSVAGGVYDYIITVLEAKDDKDNWKEFRRVRGSRVPKSILAGKVNPAQELGSALTYARRYSLYMALGLATDDDDAESMTSIPMSREVLATRVKQVIAEVNEFTSLEALKAYTEALEPDLKTNKRVFTMVKEKCLQLKGITENGATGTTD